MTLLAVERIKLFSTRSPWWCAFLALALTIGFAAMFAHYSDQPMSVSQTQVGYRFGLMVVLVLAALSITTEYRFGTIRATFQAVPNRTAALLAKTVVVAVVALVIGEAAAFGSLGVAGVLSPDSDLALRTLDDWRQVAGVGVVFAISAVLAVAVGALLRQTAGAVALLLLWPLLVESLVGLVPGIGDELREWMPFIAVGHFLAGSAGDTAVPYGPWGGLAYFAAVAVGLWVVALVVLRRRDA
ncbi:ABC transporter permease [Saccharopolyspora subtropica]|uniref:ABC transporter permease n=1 Tax=Saccharopolyspora thermophila TaxID=89367 RepID=A0A917K3J2_9PSEU|nr:ABC transporter permease [Saccharopolyspora subtropica]GGI99738.1 ABC transporter permease [Saccharopolyspora subtropica]